MLSSTPQHIHSSLDSIHILPRTRNNNTAPLDNWLDIHDPSSASVAALVDIALGLADTALGVLGYSLVDIAQVAGHILEVGHNCTKSQRRILG